MSEPDYDFLQEQPEAPAPEAPEAPEAVTVETPEAPAIPAPTAAEPLEGTHVPLAALKAEREKRQREQQETLALRQQLAQYQQQQPAAPEPDFYADPTQYVQQVVQSERQQMTQALHMALEADAREAFPDYDEVLAELGEAARDNPTLRQQVFASPNPAKAAYKLGKQLREMKAMQDPQAYRQKIEAEVRASIAAELTAKETARAAAAAAIPPDLSAARSTRDTEVAEPDDLDSILASRKRR